MGALEVDNKHPRAHKYSRRVARLRRQTASIVCSRSLYFPPSSCSGGGSTRSSTPTSELSEGLSPAARRRKLISCVCNLVLSVTTPKLMTVQHEMRALLFWLSSFLTTKTPRSMLPSVVSRTLSVWAATHSQQRGRYLYIDCKNKESVLFNLLQVRSIFSVWR